MGRLVLTNLRDRRHVVGRKFSAENRFRIGIVHDFDLSFNSSVRQRFLLYFLSIGSSNTFDRPIALRRNGWQYRRAYGICRDDRSGRA